MRNTRGAHTSGDKPIGELPKVSGRPAVGAIHAGDDPSKLFTKAESVAKTVLVQSNGLPGGTSVMVDGVLLPVLSVAWSIEADGVAVATIKVPLAHASIILPPGSKIAVIPAKD